MNKHKNALLQLFAEGAAAPAEANTGVTQADAAPEAAPQDLNAEFESLIKGKYKQAYDERVRDTIQRRLKGAKEGSRVDTAVKANAEKLCASWLEQEQETRAYYPDFDMAAALRDETFRKLLRGGADVRTAFEAANKKLISGQCLHAKELVLTHPKTRQLMHFECELPDEMKKVIEKLEKTV